MEYRDNLKCSGDIAFSFTIDAASYTSIKPVTEGYKRCGIRCLSEPDVVAFNWVHDTTFTCECLSSGQAQQNQKTFIHWCNFEGLLRFLCRISYAKKVTECNDPGLTVTGGYGNGLIEFNTIEMGHSGVIKDITVCQVVTDSGEVKNYLPSRGGQSISKELVKNKIGSVK